MLEAKPIKVCKVCSIISGKNQWKRAENNLEVLINKTKIKRSRSGNGVHGIEKKCMQCIPPPAPSISYSLPLLRSSISAVQFFNVGHSTASDYHSGLLSDSGHHNRCPPHAIPNGPSLSASRQSPDSGTPTRSVPEGPKLRHLVCGAWA